MVNDNPPSYSDSVASPPTKPSVVPESNVNNTKYCDIDHDEQEDRVPLMQAGPSSYLPTPAQIPTMHYYIHPVTGEQIMTPLPPTHPEMICLQEGGHVGRTRFGFLGVLAAIFWFPLGVGLCLLDRRVTCDRCGRTIEDGILCG